MLASELITFIDDKAQDDSFSTADILAIINEGRAWLAEEFNLPALRTSATVSAVSTQNYIALPATYYKELFWVGSAAQKCRVGDSIGDYHNIHHILESYPTMDKTGYITHAVVDGSNLLYQGQADDTLTLRFYSGITDIIVSESPDELPSNLHKPLLFNYALREMYDLIETGKDRRQTESYNRRFHRAKAQLELYVKRNTPREPKFIKGTR